MYRPKKTAVDFLYDNMEKYERKWLNGFAQESARVKSDVNLNSWICNHINIVRELGLSREHLLSFLIKEGSLEINPPV